MGRSIKLKIPIRHYVGPVSVTVTGFDDGWTLGNVMVNNKRFRYVIKNFPEKSQFGIDKGCISKMGIDRNGQTLVNYERGWDVKPVETDVKMAYKALLELFNDTMPEDCLPYWKQSVGMADSVKTARPKTKKKENLPFGL